MIVSKAPVLVAPSRKKPLSSSQEVLFTLLNKRFQRYLSGQTKSNGKVIHKNKQIDTRKSSPVKVTDNQASSVQREKTIISEDVTVSKHSHVCVRFRSSDSTAMSDIDIPTSSTLEEMECQELAEHVINQAKVKLKRRSKAIKVLFKEYSSKKLCHTTKRTISEGVCKPLLDHRKLSSPNSTSTLKTNQSPVNGKSSNFPVILQSPPSLVQSPSKTSSLAHSPSKTSSLVQSPSKTSSLAHSPSKTSSFLVRSPCKTVHLSERHSVTPKHTGIPNTPPPSPDSIFARSHNYIQSLCDTKGQRQLRSKLQDLFDRQEAAANRESQLEEKRKEKDEVTRLKAKQRAEIYALNGIMKKFEEEMFREFISGRV